MYFAKLFAVTTFLACVSAVDRIAFTQTPPAAIVGKPVTIKWAGGDNSPVTITLKKGDPADLKTVAILAGDETGTSFTWTPSSSLADGDDYALSISQGVDSINYSGEFPLSGGSNPTTILAAGPSTTFALTTISSAANASATGATTLALTTLTTANSTASLTQTVLATLSGGSTIGTGTSIPRNSTFSSQTLSATRSSSATATITDTTTVATDSSSGTGTPTGSSAPSSSTGAAPILKVENIAGFGAMLAAIFWL